MATQFDTGWVAVPASFRLFLRSGAVRIDRQGVVLMTTVWLDLWRDIVVVRRRFSPADTNRASPDADRRSAGCAYREHCSWLARAAAHPVVHIVHRDSVQRIVSTAFVGSATLASSPVSAADGARLIAALAREVHRLHTNGLVHGALQADHVIVAGNRFWLCSPATRGAAELSRTTDVAAIGRLCHNMLAGWEASATSDLTAADRRGWADLMAAAAEPSMSAARLAARAERL